MIPHDPTLTASMSTKLDEIWPDVACCQGMSGNPGGCECGPQERYLRAVTRGDAILNPGQREWCLSEIDQVEGYSRADYAHEEDDAIARGVLSAWTDYARDKGLL